MSAVIVVTTGEGTPVVNRRFLSYIQGLSTIISCTSEIIVEDRYPDTQLRGETFVDFWYVSLNLSKGDRLED
jgi:hypothetical protein